MDEKEKILIENIKEYSELAEESLLKNKFNSSLTLFFKAICAGVDLYILNKDGFVPSSHTHRFRIIQEKYQEIYEILDKDFPFYQDSYTQKINKESVEVLRNDFKRIKKILEE